MASAIWVTCCPSATSSAACCCREESVAFRRIRLPIKCLRAISNSLAGSLRRSHMLEFQCPRCGGTRASRPMTVGHRVFWYLNPAFAVSELLLGIRVPVELCVCESCTGPYATRGYVGCPHCASWHQSSLWSGPRAFGNWFGYVCPKCEELIPCLRNPVSILVAAITAPLWWFPVRALRPRWRAWQLRRVRSATPKQVELSRMKWIRVGAFYFGLPVGLLFSLTFPLFFPDLAYGESVWPLLQFLPLWLIGGVLWGLVMRHALAKTGKSPSK